MERIRTRLAELTRLFEMAGASDPAGWAESEVREDIPQLARYVFLRQAWRKVVAEGDTHWMQDAIARAKTHPQEPGASLGPALERLMACGANPHDINEVVRVMQWQLLFHFCYLLGDPGDLEPKLSHVAWALFEIDADEQPARVIHSLHESVLETDPTGREMRPKPVV